MPQCGASSCVQGSAPAVRPAHASTAASSPASHGQPRAPPPLSPLGAEALGVVGVVGVVGVEAAVTVTDAVLVAWCAASSVTVRLTVKLPAAVVATVTVAALVALVKLAMLLPAVSVHW